MVDPQRLSQLRAQRELIARHLAWLDQEITACEGGVPTSPPSHSPVADPRPPQPLFRPASVATNENLIEDLLQTEETNEPQLSKTGCWAIFALLMLLGCGGGLWVIYHFWG